jgi:hypothetical protein
VNERPVSWLLIEEGWEVVGSDGESIGKVEQVLADRDIFSGLVISTGVLGKPRWVAADQVEEIEEERVRLTISSEAADRLEEYEPPEPA